MDILSIAKLGTSMAETGTKQEIDIAVLNKARDIATSTATQLIDAIPPAPAAQNLPAHLGNTINTKA
jgi:hypothetical protein